MPNLNRQVDKFRVPANILFMVRNWCIFASKQAMPRQSISFTEPNNEWLKRQLDNNEYTSKSELINDLIRQARKQQQQVDWVRSKLESAEASGVTEESKEEILKASKDQLNG